MYEITCMAAPYGLSTFGTRFHRDLTHIESHSLATILTLAYPPTPDPNLLKEIVLSS